MKLRNPVRLTGAAALTGALLLATAACNGSSGAGDSGGGDDSKGADNAAQETVLASLDKLGDETYTVNMDMDFMGSGSFDVDVPNESQQGTFTLDFAAISEATGAADDEGMEMLPDEMVMDMIVVGDDFYMMMSGNEMVSTGDKWIHMNAEELESAGGTGMEDQFAAMDMSEMTQQMMDSLDNVEETDDNTYTGTLDMESLEKAFGGMSGGGETAEMEPVDVTIVLNDDGLLERMDMDMTVDDVDFTMSMEISDYGKELDIQAPADDEITDVEDMK
ncbi:MAG: hypothetical protein ACRDXX_13890 [Stackebrandtia sp.]